MGNPKRKGPGVSAVSHLEKSKSPEQLEADVKKAQAEKNPGS